MKKLFLILAAAVVLSSCVAANNIINLRIKNCFFDLRSTYLLS